MRPLAGIRSRAALVIVVGVAVGALTSVGQTYLEGPLQAFVNSTSAWLIAPLLVGSRMVTRRGAALAGLVVCALQLAAYYTTAHLRGYSATGAIVLFWAACSVVGGPLFGAAGHLWRTGGTRVRGLGATVLPAAFLAEGLWVYLHELDYRRTAALWVAIGVVLAVLPPREFRERRWLVVTFTAGLIGEMLLGAVYRQTFG
jgi:hypothetical protein